MNNLKELTRFRFSENNLIKAINITIIGVVKCLKNLENIILKHESYSNIINVNEYSTKYSLEDFKQINESILDRFNLKRSVFFEYVEKTISDVLDIFTENITIFDAKSLMFLSIYINIFINFYNKKSLECEIIRNKLNSLVKANITYNMKENINKLCLVMSNDSWQRIAIKKIDYFKKEKLTSKIPLHLKPLLFIFNSNTDDNVNTNTNETKINDEIKLSCYNNISILLECLNSLYEQKNMKSLDLMKEILNISESSKDIINYDKFTPIYELINSNIDFNNSFFTLSSLSLLGYIEDIYSYYLTYESFQNLAFTQIFEMIEFYYSSGIIMFGNKNMFNTLYDDQVYNQNQQLNSFEHIMKNFEQCNNQKKYKKIKQLLDNQITYLSELFSTSVQIPNIKVNSQFMTVKNNFSFNTIKSNSFIQSINDESNVNENIIVNGFVNKTNSSNNLNNSSNKLVIKSGKKSISNTINTENINGSNNSFSFPKLSSELLSNSKNIYFLVKESVIFLESCITNYKMINLIVSTNDMLKKKSEEKIEHYKYLVKQFKTFLYYPICKSILKFDTIINKLELYNWKKKSFDQINIYFEEIYQQLFAVQETIDNITAGCLSFKSKVRLMKVFICFLNDQLLIFFSNSKKYDIDTRSIMLQDVKLLKQKINDSVEIKNLNDLFAQLELYINAYNYNDVDLIKYIRTSFIPPYMVLNFPREKSKKEYLFILESVYNDLFELLKLSYYS